MPHLAARRDCARASAGLSRRKMRDHVETIARFDLGRRLLYKQHDRNEPTRICSEHKLAITHRPFARLTALCLILSLALSVAHAQTVSPPVAVQATTPLPPAREVP